MAAQLFFDINPSNGVPVYEQVARQIVSAIASGGLETGQMVPSVREMAKELAINPTPCPAPTGNFKTKPFSKPCAVPGSRSPVVRKPKCKTMRSQAVRERISHVIVEARQSQLTDDEILKMIQTEMKKKQR